MWPWWMRNGREILYKDIKTKIHGSTYNISFFWGKTEDWPYHCDHCKPPLTHSLYAYIYIYIHTFCLRLKKANNSKMLKLFVRSSVALLKLVAAIFIKFLFFLQIIALHKLWKMFFVSSKKLFSFSRYSNFCSVFHSFPHFPDLKGQMEEE